MNRIVREHYPVSKLPEDLQKEFAGQDEVTLIVQESGEEWPSSDRVVAPQQVKSLDQLFGMAQPTFKSLDEVAAHVRSLRDEWT